jgi:ATP-dependent DNA ligase
VSPCPSVPPLTTRYSAVHKALRDLPDETVFDGELVALDEQSKPNFNLLQNYRWSEWPLMYYVFDVLVHRGREVMKDQLSQHRELLASIIQPRPNHRRLGSRNIPDDDVNRGPPLAVLKDSL